MGFWDTLCPLCGVAPDGGPTYLAGEWRQDDELQSVVAELREGRGLDDKQLLQILKDGFNASIAKERVLPRGYGKGDYCTAYVGVGYWDDYGNFDSWHDHPKDKDSNAVPDGREVEILRLRDADGYGGVFNTVIEKNDNGEEEAVDRRIDCDPADSPCFFMCEHCYYYLGAWLDLDALPERSHAFPNNPEPLSFAGELYEVINSRVDKRGE